MNPESIAPSSGETSSTPVAENAPATSATEAAPLQFDRAEFAHGAALSCVACKAPLTGEYYQANGKTICPSCRGKVETHLAGGSKFARSGKALGAGLAAGVAGFIVYWAVLAISGYEFGLIAIAVGFGVGAAVRWGSNARGGWFYQLMAIAITYLSICSSYVPIILKESPSKAPFVLHAVIAFILSLGAPFFSGPLGWIILGVGLYEAWKLNKRRAINISGPYFTTPTTPPPVPQTPAA